MKQREGMKIGILQFFSWPDRRFPLDQVYSRALQRIEIMDQTGYDSVWLAEHHFNTYSVCPSVHVMGTMVAARTTRLRIGMGVTLAALSPTAHRRGGSPARYPLWWSRELGRRPGIRQDGIPRVRRHTRHGLPEVPRER